MRRGHSLTNLDEYKAKKSELQEFINNCDDETKEKLALQEWNDLIRFICKHTRDDLLLDMALVLRRQCLNGMIDGSVSFEYSEDARNKFLARVLIGEMQK